jgi:hypothetical protein
MFATAALTFKYCSAQQLGDKLGLTSPQIVGEPRNEFMNTSQQNDFHSEVIELQYEHFITYKNYNSHAYVVFVSDVCITIENR